MSEINIQIPEQLMNATRFEKSIVIDGLIEVLGLNKSKHAHRLKPGDGENKIIAELENKYYGQLWKRKDLNESVLKYITEKNLLKKKMSDKDIDKFQKFLAKLFGIPIERITELVLKSFLVGAMVELGEKEIALNLANLPKSVRDAINQGKLTWEQVRYINMAEHLAAEHIKGISEASQHRLRQLLINANIDGISTETLAQRLFEQFGDDSMLNRDMERIAITEMNTLANAGFISGVRSGEYVVGVSHIDACGWCLDNINGKVMKVIDNPPPEYANLPVASDKYQSIAKIWDTCIWSTKTNIGRSTAKRKKVDKGYVNREHHELASPGVLCHVSGRCRWVRFYSEYMYIKDGEIKYVSSDEEDAERRKWLDKNPELR